MPERKFPNIEAASFRRSLLAARHDQPQPVGGELREIARPRGGHGLLFRRPNINFSDYLLAQMSHRAMAFAGLQLRNVKVPKYARDIRKIPDQESGTLYLSNHALSLSSPMGF